MVKQSPVNHPTGDDGWLAVSTDGFREQNLEREPGHLVKELVQNSMDAIGDSRGIIRLDFAKLNKGVRIVCLDDGCGIDDIEAIRTVFWTSKKDNDSHKARGRMGRGFKELLSVSSDCRVTSKGRCIHFYQKDGKRGREITGTYDAKARGTTVESIVDWCPEIMPQLREYFATFLVPENLHFYIDKVLIRTRKPKYIINAKLTTEVFTRGRWMRPSMDTQIELVPVAAGWEPKIYEMGIPVCPAEWEQPYHINVLQRVPMNPNRDAVMSGYPTKLHQACLATLLDEMKPDDIKRDWVSSTMPTLAPEVQKAVIDKGFGTNIVRSVPTMGVRRDFDADANDAGFKIVDTKHLAGGFRAAIQEHVPSSRDAVTQQEEEQVRLAGATAFSLRDLDAHDDLAKTRQKLVEARGGKERVAEVMAFAQWYCDHLLGHYGMSCAGVKMGVLQGKAAATWSELDVLTLALDQADIWDEPLGHATLSLLCHETAHHRAFHHGDEFHAEVEVLAGVGAEVMLRHGDEVKKKFSSLL